MAVRVAERLHRAGPAHVVDAEERVLLRGGVAAVDLPRSIINQFRFHNLLCLCLASVHLPYPFHLVLGFQPFGHAEIDEAARNRMELIVPELAKRNGVTEQLKAENQMEWVRQMNACKAQAEAIVKFELIYD